MKSLSLIILTSTLFISCTQYKMVYDSRSKTDQMLYEEMYDKDGPFTMTIAFEKSLMNEDVKVEGFGLVERSDWKTYFDGKLTNCDEYSCKIIKVNSAILIQLHLNKKKIILRETEEHSLSQHRYLFISKEGGNYILYFSNYPKAVW